MNKYRVRFSCKCIYENIIEAENRDDAISKVFNQANSADQEELEMNYNNIILDWVKEL